MKEAAARGIVNETLRYVKADAALVVFRSSVRSSTRLADNAITQNMGREDNSIWIGCAFGKSRGAATTNDLSSASLKAAAKRALEIARLSPPDPEYMPPAGRAEMRKYPKIAAYVERTARLDHAAKARQLAAAARRIKSRGFRLSGSYTTDSEFIVHGNSAGLRTSSRRTGAEAHMTVLAKSGSGWAQRVGEDSGRIDVLEIASEALEIAEKSRSPKAIPAGKYDVIMRPAAVAELMEFLFLDGFDAKEADEGHNFLRGKLGKRVFGRNFSLRSDPCDPRCPGSPFTYEFLASRPLHWVRRGKVENLDYSRFWAKKKGKSPTRWGENLIMDGGEKSVDEMVAATKEGLLITRFWYIRFVDPMAPSVTGMTRDGLFIIRNGRVTGSAKHMRFNENLAGIFSRIEALGAPQRAGEYQRMLVPALKVKDFSFTSATKF